MPTRRCHSIVAAKDGLLGRLGEGQKQRYWAQLGKALRSRARSQASPLLQQPRPASRVLYESKDGLVLGFFVAAKEPVAVARMIARAIAVLVNMVVSPACAVMHTVLVCARILFVGTRGVNQPDVLPNRSLQRPAGCGKALWPRTFGALGGIQKGGSSVLGLKYSPGAKKSAAGSGGRAGRARSRSGDGEGWGRDRGRVAPCRFLHSARGGSGNRRTRIAERDPDVRVALRLAFHKAVTGLRPEQDLILLIVEDELALVGLDGEHRVAFALLVAHHRDQQRLSGPSGLHQHPALEQDIILAVAEAVIGIAPALDHAPVI